MPALMVLVLWGELMQGPMPKSPEAMPNITVYEAPKEKHNGTAIVVCPGGGYGALAMGHEGKEVAEFLNSHGVTAFVLKYRIANAKNLPGPIHPAPMLDVQRAIRLVRSKAKDYAIDPNRVGVWGFSAGGHLASTAATHFDKGDEKAKDPVDRLSCRPDFAILAYPVITMEKGVTHGGSRNNLLGKEPEEKLVEFYSNEKQVTKDTPPIFLMHTVEDKSVLIENSVRFKAACDKAGVPCEFVTYEKGAHGIGLATKSKDPVNAWPEKLVTWLKGRKLLDAK